MSDSNEAKDFESLSNEAKDIVKDMVSFCINHGYRMGMDEGVDVNDKNHPFRDELESFSNYEP